MSTKPNIFLIFLVQALSVTSDMFGQRTARVVHKNRQPRILLSSSIISCLLIFVLFGAAQLFLPSNLTNSVYVDDKPIKCYHEVDVKGTKTYKQCHVTNSTCTQIECPTQGPGSIWLSIYLHPDLLLNGLLSIFYYCCELVIYQHHFAIILMVVSSLGSSFFIPIINAILFPQNPKSKPIGWIIFFLGILGTFLSVVPTSKKSFHFHSKWYKYFTILIPVTFLSIARAIWFCWQYTINSVYHVNTFGYNTIDQLLLPVYMIPFLYLIFKMYPYWVAWRNDTNANLLDSYSLSNNSPRRIHLSQDTDQLSLNYSSSNNFPFPLSNDMLSESISPLDSMQIKIEKTSDDDSLLSSSPRLSLVPHFEESESSILNLSPEHVQLSTLPKTKYLSIVGKPLWKEFVIATWEDLSHPHWFSVFMYRFSADCVAFIYFIFAVFYDLRFIYLELTLIRIGFSWIATLLVTWFYPQFIQTTPEESSEMYNRYGLIAKVIGSCVIGVALILLNM